MSFIHHLTHCFVVTLFECITHSKHAFTLTNHIVCAECIFFAHLTTNLIELFVTCIAQAFHFRVKFVDSFSHAFATATTIVVRRTHEFVFHLRIHQHEFVTLWIEGEVFELTATAVQTHQRTSLTVYRSKLVHNTAVATHILVFCALTHASEFHLLYFVATPNVVERKSINRFERSRRTHTSTEGNIACKRSVESFNGNTEFHHFTANTEDVACPASRWSLSIVQREFGVILQVDGVSTNSARAVGFDFSDHTLLHSTGENKTIVVVSVFTNQVDTTR